MSSSPSIGPHHPAPPATLRVGFQGQAGSFGREAAAFFGEPVGYPSFAELLAALAAGQVDRVVLPFANRASGPVVEALEALSQAVQRQGLQVVVEGEHEVAIRLALAARAGMGREDVREVLSQAPALRQCRHLLAALDAVPVECSDTARAALEVAAGDEPRAAVCSAAAATAAGLTILADDVSDVVPNGTRFWHLRRAAPATLSAPPAPAPALSALAPRLPALPLATAISAPTEVQVGPFRVGGGHRAMIAGPCSVESPEQIHRLAELVARAGATALRGGTFKPRSTPYTFQGLGVEALRWLRDAGDAVGLPVITEITAVSQLPALAAHAQMVQIGARNCQNYELLKAVGESRLPVLLKRGFGTTVEEWLGAAEYLLAAGNPAVMLCERGIRTFEPSTRGTLDLGGLLAARALTHLPLLADPSHAAGRRDLVPPLARASWGAGVDGLIVEVHDQPENALSDGSQALLPADLENLMDDLRLPPGPRAGVSVERLRRSIDGVDREIGALVRQRLALCRRLADVKRDHGRPLRDEPREAVVRHRYAQALGNPAHGDRLAEALISLGLEVEGWQPVV